VRNWQIGVLSEAHPVFQITGHPDLGGSRYGAVRPIGSNTTFRWIWIPGNGLCADSAPYGDENTYEPQCPFLTGPVAGEYPCGIAGTAVEIIKTQMGCRWLPEFMEDASWQQWITDHPLCSFEATPVP